MAESASRYRMASVYRPAVQYEKATAYVVPAGLTPPDAANGVAGGPGGKRANGLGHAGGRASDGGVGQAANAGLTDISIKVRMIAAFVLLAVAAVAMGMITGLQLDAIRAAVPDGPNVPDSAAVDAAIAQARTVAYLAAASTAALAVILGIVLALSVANPVQRITQAMSRVASGETDVAIPQARSADEIGIMAGTIATFQERSVEIQRLTAQQKEEQARQIQERRALQERLGADLDATVSQMLGEARREVDDLRTLSQEMFDAQRMASERANEIGSASQRASGIAVSFSGSVDDLSNAISDIEQRVEQTSEMSDQAAEDAREADTDINALVQAADSITQIIDLINDIAGKTNMLALNAAVEAVRAGDAGRSFQVVAREIKNLSRQTAEATKQVEGHIADIRGKTDNTAKRMRGIIDVIGMINTAASEIKGAVEQQSRTAAQISQDARETSRETQSMQESIQSVASQTQQTEASAGRVRDRAESVGERVNHVQSAVDDFLNNAVKAD